MEAVLVASIVVAVGMVMIYLAKIAKFQNDELKRRGITEWSPTKQPASIREAVTLFFFGPQPKFLEVLGRSLVVLITSFVVLVLLGVIVLIVIAQLKS